MQRRAFELIGLEGLSVTAAARELRIGKSAASQRLKRYLSHPHSDDDARRVSFARRAVVRPLQLSQIENV